MNETQNQIVKASTARELIHTDYFIGEVGKVLPRHIRPTRFVRCVETQMALAPKLKQCDPPQFALKVLQLAQLGLEPDGRRAHLIPFKNNAKSNKMGRDIYDCTLIVGYQGLAELATNTGEVANIHADVVCDADHFKCNKGELLIHEIDYRKPRGPAYMAYALIRFKNGTEKFEPMTQEQIYSVRDKSSGWQAYKKGYTKDSPWLGSSEHEMWKKTAFRRACKWIKLSPEAQDTIQTEDEPLPTVQAESGEIPTSFTTGVSQIEIGQTVDVETAHEEPYSEPGMEQPPQPEKRRGRPRGSKNKPSTPEPEDEPPMDDAPEVEKSSWEQLADLVTEAGFTFDQFNQWATREELVAGDHGGFNELSEDFCRRMLRAQQGLINGLKAFVGGGQ